MGQTGELDLNGCSLTLTSLNDDSFVNASNAGFASITDTSTGTGTTELPVTTLTLDIPSGQSYTYSGAIAYTGGVNPDIRVIKTGEGTFVPNGDEITSGGFEIDAGTVKLGTSFYFSAAIALTMNGGTLDLNGTARAEAMGPYGGQPVLDLSQLDGLGGTITDYSQSPANFQYGSGTTTYSSLLQVAPSGSGHPSVFGGRIKNGTNQLVALELINGSGTLVLTADMSGISAQYAGYTGGTVVESGCLQIGDGQTPGSAIEGPVDVGTADGLVFDVAAGDSVNFSGPLEDIYDVANARIADGLSVGSILKTGPGSLTLDPTGQNYYQGAMTVNDGELQLGMPAHWRRRRS